MDKKSYISQSQLLNEQSNESACGGGGVSITAANVAVTELPSNQMDFQTMKAASDTAKVS